jgi:hypothetical protein
MYECMIPQCSLERELRNRGLCIVHRGVSVVRSHRPNVQVRTQSYTKVGKRYTFTAYETPAGTLTTLDEAAGFTSWRHEKMFKSPDDYKTLLFFLQDEQFEPCYGAFAQAESRFGEDAIFRVGFGLEPLQTLISSNLIGMEDFCIQWMENRDEILRLYEAVVEKRRQVYPLVAQSPCLHANYGGNVVPEVIGLENFRKYYIPHYNEAADIMHRHGKLIGCHFDDDCRLLAPGIAETGLDYIEAFTPAPDTDMTLAEARKAWPGKVIWINFPSSRHLKSAEQIETLTVDLAEQAGRPDGLLFGITEDIPPDHWQKSCKAIMDGLDRHAGEHPEKYV